MIRLMYVGHSKDAWEVMRRAVAALPDDAELRLLRGITAELGSCMTRRVRTCSA